MFGNPQNRDFVLRALCTRRAGKCAMRRAFAHLPLEMRCFVSECSVAMTNLRCTRYWYQICDTVPWFPIQTPLKDACMKKNEPVTTVMTALLTTARIGDPLSKLRKMFVASNVHHIPVVSGDNLVGIVSWNDMLRISFGEIATQDGKSVDNLLDHQYELSEVMNKEPKTISVHGTVRDAARILGSNNFHSLPVVDGEKLVGIVTSTDLINYLASL